MSAYGSSKFFITSLSTSKKNRKIIVSGYDKYSYNRETKKLEYCEENEEQFLLRVTQILADLISRRMEVKSANDYKIYLAYNETEELLKFELSSQIHDFISNHHDYQENGNNKLDFFLQNCKIEFKLIAGEMFLSLLKSSQQRRGKFILRGTNQSGRKVSMNKTGTKVTGLRDFEMSYGMATYLLNEICANVLNYEWTIEPVKEK